MNGNGKNLPRFNANRGRGHCVDGTNMLKSMMQRRSSVDPLAATNSWIGLPSPRGNSERFQAAYGVSGHRLHSHLQLSTWVTFRTAGRQKGITGGQETTTAAFAAVSQILYSLRLPSSRGDWMALELFVQGTEGWGEDVRRLVMAA